MQDAMHATQDRYVVISADCHAGADIPDYRPYLDREWHDEFDAWAASFVNPYGDRLLSDEPTCNWDSASRLAQLEADGIAAEVIFPNTVPPFYPQTSFFVAPPPSSAHEYRRRWAGLKAHNRWLAEFCADAPGRRAGVAQLMLNDVDDAVAEVRWVRESGLTGGVLLPGVPPGASIPPLWSPSYEPIWAACEEYDVPVNHHGGGGLPEYGFDDLGMTMLHLEVGWFAHRALWQLIFAGVFERHPGMRLVLTEQGAGWLPQSLSGLDASYHRYRVEGSSGNFFGGRAAAELSKPPSEYFAECCYVGASFLHRNEAALRDEIGVDKIMWGSDYPHVEGSHPYSREALRCTFEGVPEPEVRLMVGGTAARVYEFDLEQLAAVAAGIGPTVAEIAEPLTEMPESFCNAFDMKRPARTV